MANSRTAEMLGALRPNIAAATSLNGYNLQVPPCQVQAEKVPYADHVGGRTPLPGTHDQWYGLPIWQPPAQGASGIEGSLVL